MREGQRDGHIWAAVTREAWAILPDKMHDIMALLELRAAGVTLTPEDVRARIGGDPPARRHRTESGNVATIPIFGVLSKRMNMMTEMSGGTSTEQIANDLRAAADDPAIASILLVIDSPGGQVSGITELASQIRSLKNRKRIVAAIDPLGASAAYWLAAQTNEIAITPSGMAGSIGIIAAHQSMAGALDKAGIETTLVTAGQFKGEGNPFEKLTPGAKAAMQQLVDTAYTTFVRDVAKGRRTTEVDVRKGYGQGRVLDAESALRAGLVDSIETFDQVFARLQASGSTLPARTAQRPSAPIQAASSSLAAKRVALDLRARRVALAQHR